MYLKLFEPLVPYRGPDLHVIRVARVSTTRQSVQSLVDQRGIITTALEREYAGKITYHDISSQGSGEHLDRKEIRMLEALVDSGNWDVVICEELGRLMRDFSAIGFCGRCIDNNVRMLALNDHLDTADPNWRDNAMFASMQNVRNQDQLSTRGKGRLREKFVKDGLFQHLIFGYEKMAGLKGDANVRKIESLAPVILSWFKMLDSGASFAEIADHANAGGHLPGPHCTLERWTGTMMGRYLRNPMLKGVRYRNKKHSVKHHGSGHRRSKNAPAAMLITRLVPHLAFIEASEFDRIIGAVDQRNDCYKRKGAGNIPGSGLPPDPRANVPKKRTLWPGQHCYCAICKRMLVYGAHGRNDHLICQGAREHQCWSGVSFDAKKFGPKLVQAILQEIQLIPGWDDELRASFKETFSARQNEADERIGKLRRQYDAVGRQIDNLTEAIAQGGSSIPSLIQKLESLEQQKSQFARELLHAEHAEPAVIELPSIDQIRLDVDLAVRSRPITDQEFNRLMKMLIKRIEVFPVRSIRNDDHPRLRARFQLDLVTRLVDGSEQFGFPELKSGEIIVDLFDPPQREANLQRFLAIRKEFPNATLKSLAEKLGVNETVTQRVAELVKKMDAEGVTDPYVPLLEPPENYTRMKRHLHRRYRFEPLDEYPTE